MYGTFWRWLGRYNYNEVEVSSGNEVSEVSELLAGIQRI